MKNKLTVFFILASFLMGVKAQVKEFTHPSILSFENEISPATADTHSQLSISTLHYKHQKSSLSWKWNAPSAQWFIKKDIGFTFRVKGSKDASVSTFVFWVYGTQAIKDGKMKVEFLKDGRVCSWFEYGLNFTGWRGAWIGFERDMQGKPEEGMNEMRITAPATASGQLFFDHIILSSLQDVRQHTADFQAPYINEKTDNHWLILYKSWVKNFDMPLPTSITPEEKKGITEIQQKLINLIIDDQKPGSLSELTEKFRQYNVQTNADGTLNGLPVFLERFGETYDHLGGINYAKQFSGPMGFNKCSQVMLKLAIMYHKAKNEEDKTKAAEMYILLMRHLMDQGFQAGSAMGTLHHSGYSMRDYYTAAFLMEQPMRKAGIEPQVQQAVEWFSGAGEVKTKPEVQGMDIDAFNTCLTGRLVSILLMNDSPEKVRYLHAFTRWIDYGFLPADGTAGSFKIDGCIYHHRSNYPAYAVGGLNGAVNAAFLLNGTAFTPKQQGLECVKNALLAMRTYCNKLTWPLSLSGRHPDGKGDLIPAQFARMALAGSPDGTQKIDPDLAAAYLRLSDNQKTKFTKTFENAGLKAETSPNGNWTYNYSCLGIHRRADWSVAAMGHSRYLWATETYVGANLYGRYLNHGGLQIMCGENPISNFTSGFKQEGWDWNHFPGTTATVRPMTELRADVKNLDANSGYEEELLSDESFAGAIHFRNKQGAFGMKLHEHDKYNGSLRARKSVFFFDNRVIALGSNIRSALAGKPTHTTLFQAYLPQPEKPVIVNGAAISEFPYDKQLASGNNCISDGLNNYFFVKQGNVVVKKSLQHSIDEETDEPTQNNFALGAINHGICPSGAGYEYMILVQPTEKEINTTTKQLDGTKNSVYTVLQQDSMAHIVKDNATGITGYMLFEAGKIKAKSDILSTSVPCMAMTALVDKKTMEISVCDPDLHFYEGPSDEVFDANGKRLERSIYSRKWIDNPSALSELELVFKGRWKVSGSSEYIRVKNTTNETTTVLVKCQHGLTRECKLIKE